jgi:hypothetical protein
MRWSVIHKITGPFWHTAALVLWASVSACAADPHENFKAIMRNEVGKSADDPNTPPGRLYSNRTGERVLANGNVEIRFRHFRACHYYFEIDKAVVVAT